jgi:hypothetical protein
MATQAELNALIASQLASGTEITAVRDRTVLQALTAEMFLAQSRGDVLAAVQSALAIAAGDKVLVIRGGQAFLLDADEFGFIDTFVGLSDVNIPSPSNNQIVAYDFASSKFIAKDLSDIPLAGAITGSGTVNKLVKFTAGSVIGDSIITDDGSDVNIAGSVIILGSISSGLDITSLAGLFIGGVQTILKDAINTMLRSPDGSSVAFFGNTETYNDNIAHFWRDKLEVEFANLSVDGFNLSRGFYIGDGRKITNAIIDLGTNPTAYDLLSKTKARFTVTYTATNTLTFSNATVLEEFTMQLTNTNANTITFAGVTLYFKTDDLPIGVTFAANALTFPADSAVKYNIVGVRFDGSTFDCKIEIR